MVQENLVNIVWIILPIIISIASFGVSWYYSSHTKKIEDDTIRLNKEQEKLNKKYNDAFDIAKVRIIHKKTKSSLYSYLVVSNIGGSIARNVWIEFISENAPDIIYQDNLKIIPTLYDGGDSFQYSIYNKNDVPVAVVKAFWVDDSGEQSLEFPIQLYKID